MTAENSDSFLTNYETPESGDGVLRVRNLHLFSVCRELKCTRNSLNDIVCYKCLKIPIVVTN
jgi:hypothetical protein